MKIAVIMGSPKGMKGYTGMLIKPMLDAMEEAGAEVTIYSLGKLKVNFCKACTEICHKTGVCHQDDDCKTIIEGMLEADGVIFATPNYNYNVTAQLKALIDRCNLPLHCQRFSGKYGAIAVTCGGSDPEVVEGYLKEILTAFGFRLAGSISGVQLQFEDPEEKAELKKAAVGLGKNLMEAIQNQTVYPELEEKRLEAFGLMAYLVQTQKELWPLAYEYWETHWGLEED